MIMRRLAGFVLALAYLAGWMVQPAAAQPLADRVPDDALLFISWSGSQHMGPQFANSNLKAVLDVSDFSKLIDESLPRVFKKVGAQDAELGEIMSLISTIGGPMWRHPSAFYFGGLAMAPNAPPVPKFAILCEAGNEAKAMADQLKKVLANLPAPYKITVEEQGGMVMVAAGNAGWGAGQKPAKPLSGGARFQAALAQVQKQSVMACYVDVEGIMALVDQLLAGNPQAAQLWPRIRESVGLGGVKRIILTSGFDGKDWLSTGYVEVPAPRTGVIPALFDSKPLSTEILKAIPQSATMASAGRFDLAALVANIRGAINNIEPGAGQMVDGFLAQAKQQTGVDIIADVVAPLGDEWAVYVDPNGGGSGMLGFALVNKARDAAKLEQSLGKLEGLANQLIKAAMRPDAGDGPVIEFKQSSAGGVRLHYFAIPLVTPTWAVKDGNLYAGLYPQVVIAAAEHVTSGGKSISDNAAFQAVQKRLGVKDATSVSFANLPQTAPQSYQDLLMLSRLTLGIADLFGADTPPLVLPPLGKVLPLLSPAGSASWVDQTGWHFKGVEPFPGSSAFTPGAGGQVMVAQTAVMTSILLPSLNRAREAANRVKCANNLSQIGRAIMLYANENKGKFPPDIAAMVKTQDISVECFLCPAGHGDLPGQVRLMKQEEQAAWANANSHYVYLGAGMKNSTPADMIVAYEKPENHRGQGMNLLFADGHVEWMQMPGAMQLIEKQQKK